MDFGIQGRPRSSKTRPKPELRPASLSHPIAGDNPMKGTETIIGDGGTCCIEGFGGLRCGDGGTTV